MLGFQGPTLPQDHVHHVLGERAVAVQLLRAVEAVGEHEVDVAILGMTEDHAVAVAVLVEELDQLDAGAPQGGHRHDDVLQQCRGALRAGSGHGGVQPLAQVPQLGASCGVGAEGSRCAERKVVQQADADLLEPGQPLRAVGVVLHEQCGVVLDGQVEDDLGSSGQALAHLQGERVHQLQGRGPGLHQCRQSGVGGLEVREHQQPGGHMGQPRDGPEHGSCDEAQRSLAAHDQVSQDVRGTLEVQQRVHAVAHGVLH